MERMKAQALAATAEGSDVAAPRRHPAFSVCIATRNRPDDLRKAIESVFSSRFPVHQLIVSDDSTDARSRDMVTSSFPQAVFMEGPRRGLSANRNNALLGVTGTHVLFIDDDVVLDADFLGKMASRIGSLHGADRVIVTGTEMSNGVHVFPHDMGFLGFQDTSHAEAGRGYSVVINSTVFPRQIFYEQKFDESLVYGYDDIDFAARAVCLRGYRVHLYPEAVNQHHSSPINREFYVPFTEASRIYVAFKKYYWLEKRRGKALCYLALACSHNLLHNLRRHGAPGLAASGRTVSLSMSHVAACFRNNAPHV